MKEEEAVKIGLILRKVIYSAVGSGQWYDYIEFIYILTSQNLVSAFAALSLGLGYS